MKLLRLLDGAPLGGEFRRLGEARTRRADARIVAATHHDLERAVREGRFRADLWYRLAAIEVTLPALRARGDDVLLLARAFLARARPGAWLDAGARAAVEAHAWPGNVRELAQAMAHAAVFAGKGGAVGVSALPGRITRAARAGEAKATLEAELAGVEAARIDQALREAGGNRSRAARRLGLSRQGLWRKLKRRALE
jgi:transcriptional regulator with PAS, ATPase and Fis domain